MSVPALLSSVTAATATATALFLICKSRLMRLRPHEKNLVTLHREQLKSDARGKMIFFSQIGTSKDLAKRLCDKLESNGVVLELVDAQNYEPEALPKENLVVLVASTSEVWNQLSTRSPFSLDNIPFGAEFFAD
ncbi:hypothetical protein PIB30_109079, partial [Stylosanthes scabra]|nr:hypothetical protein [Stylosanthes scabra]